MKKIVAAATVIAGLVGVTALPASAREATTSYKDNCVIWIGNVTKPTTSTRQVKVSVRCPFKATVSSAYVGLWKDVNNAADNQVGSNHTVFSKGTVLAADTTYTRYESWTSSASSLYGRFTFQVTKWTFPAVVESASNS